LCHSCWHRRAGRARSSYHQVAPLTGPTRADRLAHPSLSAGAGSKGTATEPTWAGPADLASERQPWQLQTATRLIYHKPGGVSWYPDHIQVKSVTFHSGVDVGGVGPRGRHSHLGEIASAARLLSTGGTREMAEGANRDWPPQGISVRTGACRSNVGQSPERAGCLPPLTGHVGHTTPVARR
jgi:hypothetical protein